MRMAQNKLKVYLFALLLSQIGCQPPKAADNLASQSSGRYLYVATGLCNSGASITTFTATTASNLILKINTDTGIRDSILADYSAAPATAGDSPVGIVDWDTNNLLALVLNGTSGRVEILPKNGGTRSSFGLNPGPSTTLATAPRGMIKTSDGGLLIMRTGFIEKISSTGIRVGSPWVNNTLAAPCSAATVYSSVVASPSLKIIATHAAATNKTFSIPATGTTVTTTCLAAQAAPVVTYPTASAYDHTNNKLIIAYGASTAGADFNSIYVYDYNDSTGAITNPQKIYDSSGYPSTYGYLLFGISAITLDETTSTLYVATAISTTSTVVNYNIEKFKYDPTVLGTNNNAVLTRTGTVPFYNYGIDTKCISQMVVGN